MGEHPGAVSLVMAFLAQIRPGACSVKGTDPILERATTESRTTPGEEGVLPPPQRPSVRRRQERNGGPGGRNSTQQVWAERLGLVPGGAESAMPEGAIWRRSSREPVREAVHHAKRGRGTHVSSLDPGPDGQQITTPSDDDHDCDHDLRPGAALKRTACLVRPVLPRSALFCPVLRLLCTRREKAPPSRGTTAQLVPVCATFQPWTTDHHPVAPSSPSSGPGAVGETASLSTWSH